MHISTLTLVPTPLGNLKDITLRAIEVLEQAEIIYCEDTRVTGKLLQHLGIRKPLKSLHQNNEHRYVARIVDDILEKKHVAYCSDAGTPGISDPGYLLIKHCLEAGIQVQCLPGPTAVIPALVMSGFPSDRFVFEGFLPHKKGRVSRIETWKEEERTVVLFESTHRIFKTLKQMMEILGPERQVAVCREISKIYEESRRGSLEELCELEGKVEFKGEIVIVLNGKA